MKNKILILLSMTLLTAKAHADTLSLEQYLNQVAQKNGSFQSSQLASEGASLYKFEGSLTTKPRLFTEASYTDDRRQTSNASFQGTNTSSKNGKLGLENTFSFGLYSKLYYNLTSAKTSGLSPFIFTGGTLANSNAGMTLELVQPIWKGGFGSEVRANAQIAESNALATFYGESQKNKLLKAKAEMTYINLVGAREIVKLQEELLDRAKKIDSWASSRANKNLSDLSDALQAKAAYQQRELDTMTAKDDLRSASATFNLMRGAEGIEIAETLLLDPEKDLSLKTFPQTESSELKSMRENLVVLKSSAKLAQERATPNFDLFANAGTNGVDPATSAAIDRSFTGKYNYYTVGLRFSMPLWMGEASDIRQGREKQQLASEHEIDQQIKNDGEKFYDLNKKLSLVLSKLELMNKLVKTQEQKLKREKDRLNFGRTTTYQVLVFEQDSAQARLQIVRTLSEAYSYQSQLKVYTAANSAAEQRN